MEELILCAWYTDIYPQRTAWYIAVLPVALVSTKLDFAILDISISKLRSTFDCFNKPSYAIISSHLTLQVYLEYFVQTAQISFLCFAFS